MLRQGERMARKLRPASPRIITRIHPSTIERLRQARKTRATPVGAASDHAPAQTVQDWTAKYQDRQAYEAAWAKVEPLILSLEGKGVDGRYLRFLIEV